MVDDGGTKLSTLGGAAPNTGVPLGPPPDDIRLFFATADRAW